MSPLKETTADSEIGFVHFIAAIAAIGGLLFGFDTGVIAGALIYIKRDLNPTIFQQELVVSVAVLGALFGALSSGRLADLFGRKRLLLGASFSFILGTVIAAFAQSVHTLVIGRFVLGVAIGIASYASPLFISEVAPPKARGGLVTLNVIAITGGQVIAFLADLLLKDMTYNWRLMIGLGIIPSFLLLLGMIYAPHSPRWLIYKGAKKEAIKVLKRIRGVLNVDDEIKQMEESLMVGEGTWKAILSRKVMPVMIVGLALGIFQQLVGINTVMYYGPEIFAQVGFSGDAAQIAGTLGLGIVNALMATCVLLTVDRWGRRKLMILGTGIACVSLLVFGFSVIHPGLKLVSVVCLVTYIAGYGISLGVLFWVLISEIFPLEVRGLAMSIVTGVQWGANFIVSLTFLSLLNACGPRNTFWLYGFMALLACLFSFFFVPETKGVSLEQIEKNLRLGKRTRDLGT